MNLGKAFGVMAFVTFLSRISGFVRVAVFAAYFGGGIDADIFLSVMILPDLLYRFTSDGLVSSAALPMFVRVREDGVRAKRLFWTLFWSIFLLALPVVLALILFADPICEAMLPGFMAASRQKMVTLWRVMVPYCLFALLSALFIAYLNANRQFGRPATGPILVNAAIILGIFWCRGAGIERLGWFVLLGGILQFLWLMWLSFGLDLDWLLPRRREFFDREALGEFLNGTGPIACWIFLTPIIPLFDRYLLSSQPEGSISFLNYTDKIMYLPLGIISVSLTSVVFPKLSQNTGRHSEGVLSQALWGMGAFMIPVGLVLGAAAPQAIDLIYQRGNFGPREVALTGELLRVFSYSLIPVSAVMLFNRLFFALGNFRIPFMAGVSAIVFQVWLDNYLVHRIGPMGVAWGSFGSALLQVMISFGGVYWLKGRDSARDCLMPILAALGASVVLIRPVDWCLAGMAGLFPAGKAGELALLGTVWAFLQGGSLVVHRQSLKAILAAKFDQRDRGKPGMEPQMNTDGHR